MSTTVRTRAARSAHTILASGLAFGLTLSLGTLTITTAQADPAESDRITSLMGEFGTYWQPDAFDATDNDTKAATAYRGQVTDAGRSVLKQNDEILQQINAKGAVDPVQSKRALIDADYDWKQTYADALGPVLSGYFTDGLADGSLPQTTALYDAIQYQVASTGKAKTTFNYPRPFLPDRSFGDPAKLNGLAANLGITEVAPWTDPATGLAHDGTYDEILETFNQAFPSGHTAYAYGNGIVLATLLPELGPEIITRASEAGLARNVLGVHYPLDVIGGRISGHNNVASLYSTDGYVESTILPVRAELTGYLAERCEADGHGSTLAECIDEVGANDDGGYTNAFTDVVSTAPVVDRASALTAYKARMTYGLNQVNAAGQAPKVPEGAEQLLVTAFPDLTDAQRRAVLAATEIDSGYPLDSSSEGWQRIDLAAALSSKVTLNSAGDVVAVEPGQKVASVVKEEPPAQPKDHIATLLGEFETYWKPETFDTTNEETKAATAYRGQVTDAGRGVLKQNDETLQAINAKGAADPVQSKRALIDADLDWKLTYSDALGPVLGAYFAEGLADGSLSKTTGLYEDIHYSLASTGNAKFYYNYPRPFLEDRSFGDPAKLNGLATNLGITEIPEWTDPATGITHDGTYDEIRESRNQAFPSGHTAYAYGNGIVLATLLPELGPEIITRASEAGLARNVLGVHYPLDVIGGRISGHVNVANLFSTDGYVDNTILPVREELTGYLAERCEADGHGSTLAECIDEVGANDDGGYTNAFTDAVSTAPVVDRASALTAYEARMTYGFDQVTASGKAPVVPEGAEDLLVTAFPDLTDAQRQTVLAATEIDSGYPLDSSSEGWQRIDLAAALSSKVTVDAGGQVISVEPGQKVASVVFEKTDPTPTPEPTSEPTPTKDPAPNPTTGGGKQNPGANPSSSKNYGKLPNTGADVLYFIPAAALLLIGGGTIIAIARRKAGSDQ
ncbi:MAG: phosphatase PAP2 family protein [Ancrocorticia sp.]